MAQSQSEVGGVGMGTGGVGVGTNNIPNIYTHRHIRRPPRGHQAAKDIGAWQGENNISVW